MGTVLRYMPDYKNELEGIDSTEIAFKTTSLSVVAATSLSKSDSIG